MKFQIKFAPFFGNILLVCLLLTGLVLGAKGNGFFWDTLTLSSKSACYFFDNQFNSFLLPADLDAGHPPFMGWYLACVWFIFGQTLSVSHLAMLPFLMGIVWQIQKIISKIIPAKYNLATLLLLLTDATFLSQATLVSPDIIIVFAFLLALNGIINKKKWQVQTGVLLLAFVSLRGLFAVGSLVIFYLLFFNISKNNNKLLVINILKLFVPPFLLIGFYFVAHYFQKNWWIFTPNSAWSGGREIGSLLLILKNIAIAIWRILDFGRLVGCLIFVYFFVTFLSKKYIINDQIKFCAKILCSIFIIFLPVICISTNPIGHRYWMIFNLFTLLSTVCAIIFYIKEEKIKQILFGIIFLSQLSGNFWHYPTGIAMGWDATLAHHPYYSLRNKVVTFLALNNINRSIVGSAFPNLSEEKYYNLSESVGKFKEKDLLNDKWILYSNIFNDFSKEETSELALNWRIKQRWASGLVEFVLYEKP